MCISTDHNMTSGELFLKGIWFNMKYIGKKSEMTKNYLHFLYL
jgi:hypothetical protein